MGRDAPQFVVGTDYLSRALAKELDVSHVYARYGYYPREPLFGFDPETLHNVKGKYGIVVARYDQGFGRESSELSHQLLGLLAITYTLNKYYDVQFSLFEPLLGINKQDKRPGDDPGFDPGGGDYGKVPLLDFLFSTLRSHSAKEVISYHPHRPEFRCGGEDGVLWDMPLVSLSLVDTIADRIAGYHGFSPNKTLVVCADKKRVEFSSIFADRLEVPSKTLEVKRTSPSRSKAYGFVDADGMDVWFIDDTGHSFSAGEVTCGAIRNARTVNMFCIHSPLSKEGWEILKRLLSEGVLNNYFTFPTVRLSRTFRRYPGIHAMPTETLVDPVAHLYQD